MLTQALEVAFLLYEVDPTRVPVWETLEGRGASCMEHHLLLCNDIISSSSTASESARGSASVAKLAACAAGTSRGARPHELFPPAPWACF